MQHSITMKTFGLSENGHYCRMCEMGMGTLYCAEAGVRTLQQLDMCQAILPHLNACKYDFLLPDGAD
jgi:hypothetical protein